MAEPITRKWYVIQVRPKFEDKVLLQIEEKRIQAFLPKIQVIRQWSDRKKKLNIPLIPGYIFVYANNEERVKAINNTVGAIKYVIYNDKPAVVTENEIESLKIILKSPDRIGSINGIYNEGQKVLITSGPFKGLTGKVTNLRDKITVSIEELSVSLSVQLFEEEIKNME